MIHFNASLQRSLILSWKNSLTRTEDTPLRQDLGNDDQNNEEDRLNWFRNSTGTVRSAMVKTPSLPWTARIAPSKVVCYCACKLNEWVELCCRLQCFTVSVCVSAQTVWTSNLGLANGRCVPIFLPVLNYTPEEDGWCPQSCGCDYSRIQKQSISWKVLFIVVLCQAQRRKISRHLACPPFLEIPKKNDLHNYALQPLASSNTACISFIQIGLPTWPVAMAPAIAIWQPRDAPTN